MHGQTPHAVIWDKNRAERKYIRRRCICRVILLPKRVYRCAVEPMRRYNGLDFHAKMQCVNEVVVNAIEKWETWGHSCRLDLRLG
jgi:hypothetical protein